MPKAKVVSQPTLKSQGAVSGARDAGKRADGPKTEAKPTIAAPSAKIGTKTGTKPNPATAKSHVRTSPAPSPTTKTKTAPAVEAAAPLERKAKMPTKKNPADAAQSETVKAGAAPAKTNAAPVAPTKSATPAKSAATRHVAAAFVAARKKMTPALKPAPASSNEVDALKGVVEVADRNARKTVDDQVAAPKAATPAPRPAEPVRPAPVAERVAPKTAKPGAKAASFKTNEYIVYPAHGVGEIVAIEQQEVAGYKLELFVISFVKDKMILKVPLPKAASVGMRKLADAAVMKRALDTLTGRARIKRTMWSRRAQEYEAKINSGDLVSIAEVVRDLYRSDAQPEQSYSERQLYEAALDRMARELAAVQKLTDTEALKVIDSQLQKGPRRTKAEETDADESGESDDDVGEAA